MRSILRPSSYTNSFAGSSDAVVSSLDGDKSGSEINDNSIRRVHFEIVPNEGGGEAHSNGLYERKPTRAEKKQLAAAKRAAKKAAKNTAKETCAHKTSEVHPNEDT